MASLHKGEMVLTRQEAEAYRGSVGNVSYERAAGVTNNTYNTYGNSNAGSTQGGGVIVQISGNEFNVREDSDIEKLAYDLAKYIEKEALQIG